MTDEKLLKRAGTSQVLVSEEYGYGYDYDGPYVLSPDTFFAGAKNGGAFYLMCFNGNFLIWNPKP